MAKAKGEGRAPAGRRVATGQFTSASAAGPTRSTRVEVILGSAARSGLLGKKDGRIGGRLNASLIDRAKANTGITTDTELLEFALANVALEDRFAEAFEEVAGTVDPELRLGF